ncbi:MAG: type II toxin-antitoxin system HicA family toxin [Chloroflexi bacterium]|nr:type II toxin-antitoxin system HicA family toxin [Chloroflexota bacterium]
MGEGRVPSLTPGEVIRALERAGFSVIRQRGSQVVLHHPASGLALPVPMHRRELPRKTLMGIIREAGLSRQQFLDLL